MISQLKAKQGTYVVIELLDGGQIAGTLLEVNDNIFRMETEAGVATISADSVKIIWENQRRSLAEEDMEGIVEELKEMVKTQYICPSYACPGVYLCLPPHVCTAFACPGGVFAGPPGPPCLVAFAGCFPRRRPRAKPPASCSIKTAEESSVDDPEIKE